MTENFFKGLANKLSFGSKRNFHNETAPQRVGKREFGPDIFQFTNSLGDSNPLIPIGGKQRKKKAHRRGGFGKPLPFQNPPNKWLEFVEKNWLRGVETYSTALKRLGPLFKNKKLSPKQRAEMKYRHKYWQQYQKWQRYDTFPKRFGKKVKRPKKYEGIIYEKIKKPIKTQMKSRKKKNIRREVINASKKNKK